MREWRSPDPTLWHAADHLYLLRRGMATAFECRRLLFTAQEPIKTCRELAGLVPHFPNAEVAAAVASLQREVAQGLLAKDGVIAVMRHLASHYPFPSPSRTSDADNAFWESVAALRAKEGRVLLSSDNRPRFAFVDDTFAEVLLRAFGVQRPERSDTPAYMDMLDKVLALLAKVEAVTLNCVWAYFASRGINLEQVDDTDGG